MSPKSLQRDKDGRQSKRQTWNESQKRLSSSPTNFETVNSKPFIRQSKGGQQQQHGSIKKRKKQKKSSKHAEFSSIMLTDRDTMIQPSTYVTTSNGQSSQPCLPVINRNFAKKHMKSEAFFKKMPMQT